MNALSEALEQARQHHRAGDLARAEQLCTEILEREPGHGEALSLLGMIAHARGNNALALEHLRRVVELKPQDPASHHNLAAVLQVGGRLEEAAAHYEQALRFSPSSANTHFKLGAALSELGRLDQAAASLERAVNLRPNFELALITLGLVRRRQGKLEEAAAVFRDVLRINAVSAGAHNNLGIVLREQGKLEEAESSFREALRVDPQDVLARTNLGVVLCDQGRLDEAHASLAAALRMQPDFADAHNSLGKVFLEMGRWQEALSCFENAIRLEPDHALAHLNRSLPLLVMGRYQEGWLEHEWRWACKGLTRPRRFTCPMWDGAPLAERTILLHADAWMGLGDMFQFIRYAEPVRARGGRVVVECRDSLLRILATCRGIDQFVSPGTPLAACDVHAPLMSLPRIFGTSVETVPANVPYLFADPDLVERWRAELAAVPGFRLGIAWQGDTSRPTARRRAIPLAHFTRLARMEGIRLISLQKKTGLDQLAALPDRSLVQDLGSRLDETSGPFMDTAAVMKNVDLVITSDTATAHLAGALGVPVWLLLSFVPDWRWLLDREDSPWYPTMRLFRQARPGDWEEVFERVARALGEFKKDRGAVDLTKSSDSG